MLNAITGAWVVITIQAPRMQDPQLRPHVDLMEENTVTIIAKVVETDELGVWIEHNDYPFPIAEKRRPDKHRAYILIRYEHITSIAYFPELPVVKEEEEPKIGFVDPRNRGEK